MPDQPAAIWNRIAPWWAEKIGEGNDFQLRLIMPATDRLLVPAPGLRVLDLACGNGNYSRRLGRAGCHVIAADVAEAFLDEARKRTSPADGDITYCLADATDEAALLSLCAPGTLDAVVCSMAMMDLPEIKPLLRATRLLLKDDGHFVFSIPHPCFNSSGTRMTAELVNEKGKVEQVFGVSVNAYNEPTTDLSVGILNQPEAHYFFHRPMQSLLADCFAEGFVLDGLEEPAYPPGVGAKSAFSWAKRPRIPPAMVFRLRRV